MAYETRRRVLAANCQTRRRDFYLTITTKQQAVTLALMKIMIDTIISSGMQPLGTHEGAPYATFANQVLTLTLARPEQHNRLDPRDIEGIMALLLALSDEHATGNQRIRCVVVTGTGTKTFSSGYTLEAIATELDTRFENMLDALEDLPQFTIAALNGSVYGGATDLALCCDARIGLHGSKMFMPAAKIGLHYYPHGLRRYVSKLGHSATAKLMLTALSIESEEMLRIGFLTECVDSDSLQSTVDKYTQAMRANDGLVVAQMKCHIRELAEGRPDLEKHRAAYHASLRSDSLRQRLDALLKK
jgi:enoyl-CoA hydratase/carnithine racemase